LKRITAYEQEILTTEANLGYFRARTRRIKAPILIAAGDWDVM